MNKHKVTFVYGNGKSRKSLPMETAKNLGLIIGCNAAYRDCLEHLDAIVSADTGILSEVISKGAAKRVPLYTRMPSVVPSEAKSAFEGMADIEVDLINDEENMIIVGQDDNYSRAEPSKSIVYFIGIGPEDQVISIKDIGCDDVSDGSDLYRTYEFAGAIALDVAAQSGAKKIVIVGFDSLFTDPDIRSEVNNVYAGTDHYIRSGAPENSKIGNNLYEVGDVIFRQWNRSKVEFLLVIPDGQDKRHFIPFKEGLENGVDYSLKMIYADELENELGSVNPRVIDQKELNHATAD